MASPPIDTATDALTHVTSLLTDGGEVRVGQRQMAAAVESAAADRHHLLVQAGTGTGKSLAYLVPALLSRRRTVVATATKALQDQLAQKDLPFLTEHLGLEFSFAVLKGRSNYVCRQRLSEIASTVTGQTSLDGLAENARADQLVRIERWATETRTGDRAELDFEPSVATWSAVSVGARECPGAARCPSGAVCFAEQARHDASTADLIVVNQHLLALDLALDGGLLPEHDLVVIDEAHQLEDITSSVAGLELNGGRVGAFGRLARSVLANDALIADLDRAGDTLADAITAMSDTRLQTPIADKLEVALNQARNRVERASNALRDVPDNAPGDVGARKQRALQASIALLVDIDSVLTFDAERSVAWIERDSTIHLAPIDISDLMRRGLWSKRIAILTSATMPNNLSTRLGLAADEHTILDVGSPFDFEHNALLYCAASLPDPRGPEYKPATHRELEALISAAGGRTLALFTSWASMREAVEYLRPRLPWPLLVQGELPKSALLEQFSDDHSTSLFATMGFWQGIDVPGPSLSLVVIDRLPFPRPDDPLLAARRALIGPDAFAQIDVPRAATLLAQGAGRLIRTATDRGVVAVLDPRLARGRTYRWQIIAALPPMPRTRDREDAESFLRRIRDG
ncbi:MAG TPA: ATP-dependent DNA helicase [Acidimicrobiales bacterium]|nr:ATP-dependent DNA helicase [Acidimicrobiales bacterium]